MKIDLVKVFKCSPIIFITLTSCSFFSKDSSSRSAPPGLTLTLPSQTSRLPLTAVTTAITYTDTNSLVPAGSGSWVSQVDMDRIDNTYQYLLGNSTLNSLSGNLVLATKSRIYFAHQITADSAALTITVDGTSVTNIPQGGAPTGWVTTDLGGFSAGVHSVVVSTSDPFPRFAYVDGFIALPILTLASGIQQKGWFEQDHVQIFNVGTWALNARSATFPFSVSTTTDTGDHFSANTGDTITFFVEATAASTLKIYGQSANDQGILGVKINGVAQSNFDQYSALVNYKTFAEYALATGDHLVELKVSGTKNAASSAFAVHFDGAELQTTTLTDDQRAMAMIDSIVNNIGAIDGGARISHDSNLYNQDNDSGYSLMALALAVAKWNIPEHAQALKKNIQWFADIVQSDGLWYWGYCKQGDADCPRSYIIPAAGASCINNYCPSVNDYYTGLTPSITAIRSIDAPQSFPAVGLAIYASLFPEDTAFINSVKSKIVSGIDALIANNYDATNGFFYSSYQYKNGIGWTLFEAQYSAGQCDVYMGLMAAYSLTGTKQYKTYANQIKNNFDSTYFDSSRNLYSIALFGPMGGTKTLDATTNYGFTQGWCSWVFGNGVLTNAAVALTTAKTWIQGDNFSVLVPPQTDAETSQSAWLAMGLKGLGIDSTIQNNLKGRFHEFQFNYHPDFAYGHGAVKFSDNISYLYTSNAAWAFIGLTQQESPATWWR